MTSSDGRPENSASAVGLRSLFRLQRNKIRVT
jgi:hypothetical protein